jgi:hypothetical protein
MSGNTSGTRTWTDGKQEAPMLPDRIELAKCHACSAFYWTAQARKIGQVEVLPRMSAWQETIVLEGLGPDRLRVMKALRKWLHLDLAATKAQVGRLPVVIEQPRTYDDMLGLRNDLKAAGAVFRVRVEGGQTQETETPRAWIGAPRLRQPGLFELSAAVASGVAEDRDREVYLRLRLWRAWNDPIREQVLQGNDVSLNWSSEAVANFEVLLRLLQPGDAWERVLSAEVEREMGRFGRAAYLLDAEFPEDIRFTARFIRLHATRNDPVVRQVAIVPEVRQ